MISIKEEIEMDITANLIHIAKIIQDGGWRMIFLRKVNPRQFTWFTTTGEQEKETSVTADNIEEALRLAAHTWKEDAFTTFNCGFRYTLPERDEHGLNALFWQMAASYSSSSGVYYDEELGCNCIVHNAPSESRNLWKQLKEHETAQRS